MPSVTGWPLDTIPEEDRCSHGVPLRARCTECEDEPDDLSAEQHAEYERLTY